jgi:hypothetical protein
MDIQSNVFAKILHDLLSQSVNQRAIFTSRQRRFLPFEFLVDQAACVLPTIFQFADFSKNWKSHCAVLQFYLYQIFVLGLLS